MAHSATHESSQSIAKTISYARIVYRANRALEELRQSNTVCIDGRNLDISSVVAVSKCLVEPKLDKSQEFQRQIEASVATLHQILAAGNTVYGVTTGFGGSADVRTSHDYALQSSLLQHHQFGVLTKADKGLDKHASATHSSHAMPQEWVKATMLVRCNTLARGHSAVSLHVIETILTLLRNNMTPVVPLRGSISASGDLSPLSYIAGALTGSPDVYVQCPEGIVSAAQALEQFMIDPIVLGPKEGLGLMNGTAVSAAVASLVVYETHHIVMLSQVLTAMAVEALVGSVGSFDPFIAGIRPHKGQIESATTIRRFLQGSRLARGFNDSGDNLKLSGDLYQDRYALRTASQWIGPQIEDILLAHEQITTELNSTTDNPLIDVSTGTTHHGGNFQASSITSATEKTRLSLQLLGKLLFAQSSELINPLSNNGLPPNLAADEPSMSFTAKGIDIGMASYMSELAHLANPVSSHVQSAEMHNQDINSLALTSSRFTLQSVELVSLMSASHLYTTCQALDLRVLQKTFFGHLQPALCAMNHKILSKHLPLTAIDEFSAQLWTHFQEMWPKTFSKDSTDRFTYIVDMAVSILTIFLIDNPRNAHGIANIIHTWKSEACSVITKTHETTRSQFFAHQTTADYLGLASKNMYLCVRKTLGVPFHKGLEDHPTPKNRVSADGSPKQTIGSWIGVIYESLRSGQLHEPLMECLVDADLVLTEESTNDMEGEGVVDENHLGKDSNVDGVLNGHSHDTNTIMQPNGDGRTSKRKPNASPEEHISAKCRRKAFNLPSN